MDRRGTQSARSSQLPGMLQELFWDYNLETLSWENDRDLIIARVLTSGDWDAVAWLRSRLEDRTLREWMERHHGKGLSPRQLRFWELILGLPHREVNTWLRAEGRTIWEKRASR